jgi:hypothetical protein
VTREALTGRLIRLVGTDLSAVDVVDAYFEGAPHNLTFALPAGRVPCGGLGSAGAQTGALLAARAGRDVTGGPAGWLRRLVAPATAPTPRALKILSALMLRTAACAVTWGTVLDVRTSNIPASFDPIPGMRTGSDRTMRLLTTVAVSEDEFRSISNAVGTQDPVLGELRQLQNASGRVRPTGRRRARYGAAQRPPRPASHSQPVGALQPPLSSSCRWSPVPVTARSCKSKAGSGERQPGDLSRAVQGPGLGGES